MRSSWTSSGSSSALRVAPGHARAAQRRLHAAAELAQRERLGDVVVGAELEAEDLVDLLGLGGEHDDRHRRARAQPPADLEAVEARASSRRARRGRTVGSPKRASASRPSARLHDLVAVLAQRDSRAASGSTARRRRAGCGAVRSSIWPSRTGYAQLPCRFRMLDPRIYRAALVPGAARADRRRVLAAGSPAADRARRSRPTPSTAPRAHGELDGARRAPIPARRAGRRRRRGARRRRRRRASARMGSAIRSARRRFEGETIDGERTLTTVIARQVGPPGPGLVVVAHRDAAGRGARGRAVGHRGDDRARARGRAAGACGAR